MCEELIAALADGTFPESPSLEQIWITRDGRLKLLDAPIHARRSSPRATTPLNGDTMTEQAVGLLRDAVALCVQRQVLPAYVRRYADELASRPANADTLAWSADKLREAVKRPAAIRWDDRLGVLAVSTGTEFSLYALLAFVASWLVVTQLRYALATSMALSLFALLIPALAGFAFRGGPAFWLTRIQVLGSDGRQASRCRCAMRCLIAWTPMMVLYLFLGAFVAKLALSSIGTAGTHSLSMQLRHDDPETWILLGAILLGELLEAVFLMGVIYAVARPQRGLQDLLSGAWLAPK